MNVISQYFNFLQKILHKIIFLINQAIRSFIYKI